jgi:hypothetical protein
VRSVASAAAFYARRPTKGANKGCQPRTIGFGTLWGLRGRGASKASIALTIYTNWRYVCRTGCLPDAIAKNANKECQPPPPGVGILWALSGNANTECQPPLPGVGTLWSLPLAPMLPVGTVARTLPRPPFPPLLHPPTPSRLLCRPPPAGCRLLFPFSRLTSPRSAAILLGRDIGRLTPH